MAFYLSTPTGTISLQRLTQFAYTRFSFLCKILETKGNVVQLLDVVKDAEMVEESECLIEGTCKDRISHAILRLACCDDADMSEFLLTSETLLFDFRISCMTREELCKVFKSVDRNRQKLRDPTSHLLQILCDVRAQFGSWREVVRMYFDEAGYFHTSYVNVLPLVAKREVVMDRGVAHVPINRLRELTTDVFRKVLAHGLYVAKAKYFCSDERIVDLKKSLKVLFRRRFRKGVHQEISCHMLHTDVDRLLELFPPCMAHLHRKLRRKHRLSHHARVQYTLFLKEAGLPVHEALMFWRLEYSQPATGGRDQRGCRHDWGSNERRYTYSIRHLYGLEGSRINYRGHSCTALQESYNGPQEEGGCPFNNFDLDHLCQLLMDEGVVDHSVGAEILHCAETHRPSDACKTFYTHKIMKRLKENNCQEEYTKQGKDLTSNQRQLCSDKSRNQMEITTAETCSFSELSKMKSTCADIENLVPEKFDSICDCMGTADSLKNIRICGSHGMPVLQSVNRDVENPSSKYSSEKVKVQCCNGSSSHFRECKVDNSCAGAKVTEMFTARNSCRERSSCQYVHLQTNTSQQLDKVENMDTEFSHTDIKLPSNPFSHNFSKPVEYYQSFTKLVQSLRKEET